MPKTDGYKTKEKILQKAETLFAENGFNGTSINMIAKAAGINKGLIYYHFKNKSDIMVSIFRNIIEELEEMVNRPSPNNDPAEIKAYLQQKIRKEIQYLEHREKIISLLMMEALKTGGKSDFLFQCAEIVARLEHNPYGKAMVTEDDPERKTQYLLNEFFTGFIPIVSFIALQDKWCSYFNCNKGKALNYFIDEFTKTHLTGYL